jgi:hypothetical protein
MRSKGLWLKLIISDCTDRSGAALAKISLIARFQCTNLLVGMFFDHDQPSRLPAAGNVRPRVHWAGAKHDYRAIGIHMPGNGHQRDNDLWLQRWVEGGCLIVLPKIVTGSITQLDQDKVRRIENANCNGWPHGNRV